MNKEPMPLREVVRRHRLPGVREVLQQQKPMPEKLEEGIVFRFNAARYKVQRVRKNGTMIVKELKTVKH